MKSKISQLRSERQNVQKVEVLSLAISESLSEDPALLQPYLEAVLSSVLPNFGSLVPVDVKHKCFDSWLLSPQFPVLSVIVSCLKSADSKSASAHYLVKWTKRKLYSTVIDAVRAQQSEQLYSELLAIIFSIPDRAASAFSDPSPSAGRESTPVPSLLKSAAFYERLVLSLTDLDPTLLSKFAVLKLLPFVWKANFSIPKLAEAALGLSPSAVSPFLLGILEDLPKQHASAILSVIAPAIERVNQLLSSHFLTQKVLSDHGLTTLVDFLIGQGQTFAALEKCGEIWSRHRLITQMSTSLHRQLSIAILRLLPKTNQDQLKSSKATSLIMSGVSAHISISSPELRRFGLEIGERITAILLPDQAVKFDELHPKEEEEQNELASRRPLDIKEDSDSSDVDIDAPFKEGPESDSSDEELVPYAIDDDEGNEDSKVLHPRELIALFRTDENDVDRYKKFQQAIGAASDVIKKMTQFEFVEFHKELLTLLLTVDNEYNDKDFDDLRRGALVAFMTNFPVPAAKAVIGELKKKRTHALGRKLQLITAISYAASEMSELPKPEKKEVTVIEAHTRRWGHAKTKITRVSAVNKFSQCALVYFYGILDGLELDKLVLEEDGLEAAQTLTTLAVIIEASGESVLELPRMCQDLLQVVVALSTIRPPNARRALLFATSWGVQMLKEYQADDVMGQYLMNSASNDPDEMCRRMAIYTIQILEDRREARFREAFRT
jgi:hypothetical protein